MNGYIITNEMAQQLADAFYPEIAEYIRNHQEEYERFLVEKETARNRANEKQKSKYGGNQNEQAA